MTVRSELLLLEGIVMIYFCPRVARLLVQERLLDSALIDLGTALKFERRNTEVRPTGFPGVYEIFNTQHGVQVGYTRVSRVHECLNGTDANDIPLGLHSKIRALNRAVQLNLREAHSSRTLTGTSNAIAVGQGAEEELLKTVREAGVHAKY